MSLKLQPVGDTPEATARVAKAAFRKPSAAMRLRDEFGVLYQDEGGTLPDKRSTRPGTLAAGVGHRVAIHGEPDRPSRARCRERSPRLEIYDAIFYADKLAAPRRQGFRPDQPH